MLARIENAFEVQRRFTADASHELRSPLTAMRGELELALRKERDAPEYRRALESTLEEVVRLSRIAEDLLILARSDSGRLETHREPTEVTGVVASVVNRLSRDASSKGVAIETTASGDTTADLDPVLLGQAVWNLLDNAIRFTRSGGQVGVTSMGEDDHVSVIVEDDGPGFPEGVLERVFDRFFRVDPARAREAGPSGTGLGLAIVRGVAEAHGGEAVASNRPEGGARVLVRFPRHPTASG